MKISRTLRSLGLTVLRTGVAATLLFTPVPDAAAQGRSKADRPVTPAMKLPSRPLHEVMRLGAVTSVIGTEEEDGPYMFSAIGAMALGGDGTIYVGEYSSFEIRAFDRRGRHLRSFGRRGRGPGEFVQPFGLHHDGDSTLFATQGYLGIGELTARGADVRFRRTFGEGRQYGSLCTVDRRLFVTIGADSGIVREFDDDRREVRAFGRPFGDFEHPSARRLSNQQVAAIACDTAVKALFVTRGDLGMLRRYDLDGRLRWEVTLPNFTPAWYLPQGTGAAVAFSLDAITSVIPVGRTRLLALVARMNYERGRAQRRGMTVQPGIDRHTWVVLDALDGKVLFTSSAQGPLAPLSASLVAEKVEDPFPMARIRPMQAMVP